jgi:hypothetical protein
LAATSFSRIRPGEAAGLRVRLLAIVVAMTIGSPAAAAFAKSGPITFYFGLQRPEASAQMAFFAVSRPGSSSYRRFLSLRQVSARYGATPAVRRAFVRQIKRLGLTARIDGSGVFARVSGPVATFDRAFRVRITREFENDPNIYAYAVPGNGRLHLPATLAPLVRDVVPIYAHSASSPDAPAASARIAGAKPPGRTGTWTRGCANAKATGAFSFGQVRHAYRIDRLGAGAGASVAIFNDAEGVASRDIADNARCFGYPKVATRTLRIDGQTSPFTEGLFEPQEDLALVRGMAPGLRSLTFTQVWGTPGLWFLGPAQVLDAPHLPDSLSISYGLCERLVRGRGSTPDSRAGANLMDAVLARLGIAGVGAYSSSGDFGSTCNGKPFLGVTWPGSSAFVTSVGGTRLTLNAANNRRSEVVWNDARWVSALHPGGAGGGGFAVASARPPFQRGLGLPGATRMVPDVSAAASEFPGWPVVLNGYWESDAGTSGAAPLLASAMAVLSADQRRRGLPPIGPADGLFYYLAAHAPQTIYDVTHGNNGYLKKVPAQHATRGYDLASGLGVPDFGRVTAALPAPA